MSIRLEVNSKHELELNPKLLFISTLIKVQPGDRYLLSARGHWKDKNIVCDADGWTRFGIGWLRKKNRLPRANWFALVACIGDSLETSRLVGKQMEISISEQDCQIACANPAQLYVFANDWPSEEKYSNNEEASAQEGGPMRLSITRMA